MATVTKYRSVTGTFKNGWGEGEIIEGMYVGVQWVDMKSGVVPRYTLDTIGGPVSFLGTTQLITAFQRLRKGTEVRITYLGEERVASGFKVKLFNVEVAEGTDLVTVGDSDGQETLPL